MPVTLLCSCQMLCFQNQRSVISARRFHATRRVQSAARTAWPPSRVCASRAGRGHAVRKVSSHLVFWHFKHFSSYLTKNTSSDHLFIFIYLYGTCCWLIFVWRIDWVDVDECSDPELHAGCNQICQNIPGSFHCMCEEGYILTHNINCMGKTLLDGHFNNN